MTRPGRLDRARVVMIAAGAVCFIWGSRVQLWDGIQAEAQLAQLSLQPCWRSTPSLSVCLSVCHRYDLSIVPVLMVCGPCSAM